MFSVIVKMVFVFMSTLASQIFFSWRPQAPALSMSACVVGRDVVHAQMSVGPYHMGSSQQCPGRRMIICWWRVRLTIWSSDGGLVFVCPLTCEVVLLFT